MGGQHILMAALHNVLTLDVAGAAVMALNMVADCEAVMSYTVLAKLRSVGI